MESTGKFLLIGITAEKFIDNESGMIVKLLDNGLDYIHIRKPGASREDLKNLIEKIHPQYHNRLKLHDHFDLVVEYGLGGVQLNSRNVESPSDELKISRSCHSLDEIDDFSEAYPDYEYVTLSPIFNSISKKGYASAFNLDDLTDKIRGRNVIALGGVTPSSLPRLRKVGFAGAGMLGCIWSNVDNFCKQLKTY